MKNAGGFPVLLESPAFMPLEKVLKKTGYYSIVEREKIPIADTRDVIEIENVITSYSIHYTKLYEFFKSFSDSVCCFIFKLTRYLRYLFIVIIDVKVLVEVYVNFQTSV